VLGTPYYMSPEQARGLRSVDYRSDLWSVGVIAYRCIIGTLPFEGEAVGDLLVKLCTAPLPIPSQIAPDVPPGFDAWFAKALTREPEGRFASASELAESLGAVCGVSVRGSYSTADIPIPSFASGPMGSSSPAITPGPGAMTPPGIMPVTPYPTPDRTGPNPALSQSAGNANTLQMATGAPTTTQSPAPAPAKNTGAIIAAAAAAVVVLAIGGAVLLKTLGGASIAATPIPAETAPPVAPTAVMVATPTKPVEPAPTLAADPISPSTKPSAAPAPVSAVPVAKPRPALTQPALAQPGQMTRPPARPAKGSQPAAPNVADVGF
jgi:serine/threonine-protein kinase